MRIAYLSLSSLPSRTANSVHVMKMCNAFAQNGHDVTLYALGSGATRKDFAYYGVPESFEIVKWQRQPIHRLDKQGAFSRATRRAVLSRPLPDVFYGRRLRSLQAVAHLGPPMIFESHEPPLRWIDRMREQRLLRHRNFHRLVVISTALAGYYRQRFPQLPMTIAPDGADLPAREPALPSDHERLQAGYVGSLFEGRGLEIITALAERMPDVDFHVVGGDEAHVAMLRSKAPPSLHYHGHMTHADLPAHFQAFDVLLAPYQSVVRASGRKRNNAPWMSPLKIFEYMTTRRPMIASDLPALREVLADGRNALLIRPDDVEGWVQAVRRLQSDRAFADAIARAAYRDLADKYTWARRAARVIEGLI